MKQILFIIFLIPFIGKSQTDTAITYTFVHKVNGGKEELFNKAKVWISSVFANYKADVAMEDKDIGKIVGNGFDGSINTGLDKGIKFRFTIDVKDGKYRLFIDDIKINQGSIIGYSDFLEPSWKANDAMFKDASEKRDSLSKVDITRLKKREKLQYDNALEMANLEYTSYFGINEGITNYFQTLEQSLHNSMDKKSSDSW